MIQNDTIGKRLYSSMKKTGYKGVEDFFNHLSKKYGVDKDTGKIILPIGSENYLSKSTLQNHFSKTAPAEKFNFETKYLAFYAKELDVTSDYILFGTSSPKKSKKEVGKREVFNAVDILITAFGESCIKNISSDVITFEPDVKNSKNPKDYKLPKYVIATQNTHFLNYLEAICDFKYEKAYISDELKEQALKNVINNTPDEFLKKAE